AADRRPPVGVAPAHPRRRRGVVRGPRPMSRREPLPTRVRGQLAGLRGKLVTMPMRTDCKNYESRTYANGEVVRKCRVDLAPEAPWRCPDDCVGYERRMIDAGWQVGSLSEG